MQVPCLGPIASSSGLPQQCVHFCVAQEEDKRAETKARGALARDVFFFQTRVSEESGAPIWTPNSRALILRTPTKRTKPNLWKLPNHRLLACRLLEAALLRDPKRPHKHKDPTQHDSGYPPYSGPSNPNVRSLSLCHLLGPYT